MAKTVITMDDYEAPQYEDYTGEPPARGWYDFELVRAGWQDEDEGTYRFTFQLVDNELYQGWVGHIRGDLGDKKWLGQMVGVAIRGGEEQARKRPVGIPESDKEVAALVKAAKRVRGQVITRSNTETGETSHYLQKVRPLVEGASSAPKPSAPVVEAEPEVEDYTAEELEGMSLPELRKIMKEEFEASATEVKGVRSVKAASAWILEAQEEEPEGDEEEDEDEEELDPDEADEDTDEDEDLEEFDEDDEDEEPEPEPEPAPRRRKTTAPAKAAPAKAAAAPAARRRRRA